jgi:hypothetical protein
MGEIGAKIIKSSINIEEEFKKKINFNSTNMHLVKISENEFIDVLKNCRIHLD